MFLSDTFGWGYSDIASYMALWVIGYGLVQTITPKLLRHRPGENDARAAQRWGLWLTLVPIAMALLLTGGYRSLYVILGGLALFGIAFAINSAVHSYLILRYTDRAHATANVGFYYMANAAGRLLGTALSGVLYHYVGFVGCLIGTSLMLVMSSLLAFMLPSTRDIVSA